MGIYYRDRYYLFEEDNAEVLFQEDEAEKETSEPLYTIGDAVDLTDKIKSISSYAEDNKVTYIGVALMIQNGGKSEDNEGNESDNSSLNNAVLNTIETTKAASEPYVKQIEGILKN